MSENLCRLSLDLARANVTHLAGMWFHCQAQVKL